MSNAGHEYSSAKKKRERKRIIRSFTWNIIAVVCFWSAYLSIFNLQSSINVEDGLGTNTFAVAYYVLGILSIVIAPAMMQKFGAKKSIIITDCSLFLFIAANFYPRYYTLLPASIIMLILQSAGFPSMSMLNIMYANLYAAVTGKSKEHYTIRFSGYFFTGLQLSQVLGNILSYVVLYGFEQSLSSPQDNSQNCSTGMLQNSSCKKEPDRYQYCGINDCQNATVIDKYIRQYKVVDEVPLYVLLGTALALEIFAIVIHIFLIPSDQTFQEKTKFFEQEIIPLQENKDIGTNASECEMKQNHGVFELMLSSIKGIGRHIWQLQFWLLFPISFYNGLAMSFVFSEVTRSYTSCVIGVQWVGICMAIYGTFDAIFSWLVGQFGRRINRSVLFILILCAECANYAYCLLWSVSPNALLSICAIFCIFGTTDGILQTIVNVTHIDMFSKNRRVSLVAWNSSVTLGLSTGMLLSRLMCVQDRIYLNLGIAIAGTILVAVADLRYRRRNKNDTDKESNVTT